MACKEVGVSQKLVSVGSSFRTSRFNILRWGDEAVFGAVNLERRSVVGQPCRWLKRAAQQRALTLDRLAAVGKVSSQKMASLLRGGLQAWSSEPRFHYPQGTDRQQLACCLAGDNWCQAWSSPYAVAARGNKSTATTTACPSTPGSIVVSSPKDNPPTAGPGQPSSQFDSHTT
ncbi:uncharacterized protein LOC115318788 isoform X3 [Ixodes scapularis]|uniref:uncharacterized protein LOC115318788 isoform X3 n=1 Tax=Ixodes scapularis TaxID=6945 RepID=UPI001A9D0AD6|nr:uncharacterized protein LOC115318788 isoform X3 [Ixodes scapularis]